MKLERASRLALAAFLTFLLLGSGAARADWQFAIPQGWHDVSPGKPVPLGVPLEVSQRAAQSDLFHTLAVDLAGRRGNFLPNLNAVVVRGELIPNERTLADFLRRVPRQEALDVPGAKFRVVEKSVATLDGVAALRVVADLELAGIKTRLLKYEIPGGREVATLTYTATQEDFAQYLPVFEAAAQQTEGAKRAPRSARMRESVLDRASGSPSDVNRFGYKRLIKKVILAVVAIVVFVVVARRNGWW